MRLLKFDTIHPEDYLSEKQKTWSEIDQLSRKDYLNRLMKLRSNFSDFYTYNLNSLGWEAEEFIVNDDMYFKKVGEELYGKKVFFEQWKESMKDRLRPIKDRWKKKIMRNYLNTYKPDVIFVREDARFPSSFWAEIAPNLVRINRIAAPIMKTWSPMYWDLIYTSTQEYKAFFEAQKIPSIINPNGFDERVLSELKTQGKPHEISFVGGLGTIVFENRTVFMDNIATHYPNFKWWGYGYESCVNRKALYTTWQGNASGLDMFQVYKDSKIILNDYIDLANGVAVNQRIFEVLGVGSFLLTRYAKNLEDVFPKNTFVMFHDEKDCIDKIQYFLKNEKEREEIAKEGQKFILEHYNYRELMKKIDIEIKAIYQNKNTR